MSAIEGTQTKGIFSELTKDEAFRLVDKLSSHTMHKHFRYVIQHANDAELYTYRALADEAIAMADEVLRSIGCKV